jgi:hypothetical protein
MRGRIPASIALFLGLALGLALVPGDAQEKSPVVPANFVTPAPKVRDFKQLNEPQRLLYLAAVRGTDWLKNANMRDGKFVYGFLPALATPMEGDDYLAQVGAALALARSSRVLGDAGSAAIARQALLTALLATEIEPQNPAARRTAAPAQIVPRLGACGLLVLAVQELASPGKDLLDPAEQLSNYLVQQQQSDGSLLVREGRDDPRANAEGECYHAGLALQALARSAKSPAAAVRIEVVRKAHAYYRTTWTQNKNVLTAVSHIPAYTEAYLATKDQAYADTVFAMADWLLGLQYQPKLAPRPHWIGGFPTTANGKVVSATPDIQSAWVAECLTDACRAARAAGDLARWQRYRQALEMGLDFTTSLQYTPNKMRHFVEEFRPALQGGFHASHQDGNLRLDYTHHAVSALAQYLEHVAQ